MQVLFNNSSIPTHTQKNCDFIMLIIKCMTILLPPLYERELVKVTQPAIIEPQFEYRQYVFKVCVVSHCPLIYVKVLY